jgi:hypothetical protein
VNVSGEPLRAQGVAPQQLGAGVGLEAGGGGVPSQGCIGFQQGSAGEFVGHVHDGADLVLLLSVRGYPELLAAQAISRVGDSIHYIALVALIFSLTGSGLAVSGAVVFEALPVLAFGALAGAVVDRLPRRRVMITADVVRAALAVLMSQATAIPAIYALAFGLALGGVFHGPAYQSLVPGSCRRTSWDERTRSAGQVCSRRTSSARQPVGR